MSLEEYTDVVWKYSGFIALKTPGMNKVSLKKYVDDTYLGGYGYLPLIKRKKVVDIQRISDLSKTEGEKRFRSLVKLGEHLNKNEFSILLNKICGDYLASKAAIDITGVHDDESGHKSSKRKGR